MKEVARAWAYIPFRHRLRSVESVADTKLNGAAKGAALLQLISLSADAFKGLHGIYAHARAAFLAAVWVVMRNFGWFPKVFMGYMPTLGICVGCSRRE